MVEKQEGKVEINDTGVLSKDEAKISCLEEQREITDYWDISGAMDSTPGGATESRGNMKLQETANETMADDPDVTTKILADIADNVTSLTADTSNAMKETYCEDEKCAIKTSNPELSVIDKNNSNNNNNNNLKVVTQESGSDLPMCQNSDPPSEDKDKDKEDCNVSALLTEPNTVGTEVANDKGPENDVSDIVSGNMLTSGAKDNCADGENKTALSIREEMMLDADCREERFRIDRKKLEQMLQAASEGRGQSGELFFQKIMDDTSTFITWPSKLKIGAKSKKDPHIRICGKPDNIKEARQRIMKSLDTKSNRVTIKMDVSHTEHSHVIGKGGNNIKHVMQETGCHIHFPDSNRNTAGEKSNQVSITGHPEGVENARQKIRSLLPVVLQFEIPNTGLPIPDLNSPMIQQLVQVYGISIQFKQRAKVYSTSCTVRGSMDNAEGLKTGVQTLMSHVSRTQLPVTTQIEIAPQHHSYMLTKPSMNVTTITQTTGVRIIFPDPSALPKKSTVYINGTIDAVILARHKLMGCLPLLLMFDMKEDTANPNNDALNIQQLMETLDVSINIKTKPKQPSRTVIIKSIESNIYNMFEARAKLLGLESSGVARPAQSLSPKLTRNAAAITPSPVILLAHSHVPTPTVQTAVIGLPEQKAVTPLPSVVLGGPSYVLTHTVPSNRSTPQPLSTALPPHSPFPTLPNGNIPSVASTLLSSSTVAAPSRHVDVSAKGYQIANSAMSPPTVPVAQAAPFNDQRHYQVKVTSPQEMQHHINQRLGIANVEKIPNAGLVSNSSYILNHQGQYPITSMQNRVSRRSSQTEDFSQKMYSDFHSTGTSIPKQEHSFENNRVMPSSLVYDSRPMHAMRPMLANNNEDRFSHHDHELEQKMNEHLLRQTGGHFRTNHEGGLASEDFLRQQISMSEPLNSMPNSDAASHNRLIRNSAKSLTAVSPHTIRQSFGQNVRSPDSIGESRASVTSERNSPLSSISERYNGSTNSRLGFDQFDDQSATHQSSPPVNPAVNFQPLASTDLNTLSPLSSGSHHRSPPQIVLNQNLDGTFKHDSLTDNSTHLAVYAQQPNAGDISSGPPPGFEGFTPAGHTPSSKTKDYENLSKLAKKAMENKPVPSEVRTPTDVWSGWGFSKSMPFEMKEELNKIAYSKGRFRSNLPTTYENGEVLEHGQPCHIDEDAEYSMENRCPDRLRVPHTDMGRSNSKLSAWRRQNIPNMDLSLGGNMGLNYLPASQKQSAFTPIHPNNSLNRSSNSPKTNSVNVNEAMPQPRQVINSPFNNSGNESTLHPLPEKPKSYESRMNLSSTPTIQDSLGLNANTAGSTTKVEFDIPDVLNRLDLSKYIPVFQQQEVDYQTFLTLTEPDLKELGITTFGPRKKIMLAIKDLNKDRDVFSGSMTNNSTVHENISDQMLQLQRLQLQQHRDNPQTTASSRLDSHSLLSPSRQLFNTAQQSQHAQNRLDAPALNRFHEDGKRQNLNNGRMRSANRFWQNSGAGVSSRSGHW